MNTCEYCQKELKRKIFCNNSHRAMYYKVSDGSFAKIYHKGKEIKFSPPVKMGTPYNLKGFDPPLNLSKSHFARKSKHSKKSA